MQKITPFLWFNNQAEEAANFYVSLFKNSKVTNVTRYLGKEVEKVSGQKEGSIMTVAFELDELVFSALNGGPIFTFNPSVSFAVACANEEEIDDLWAKLSPGGKVLMELKEYPFSKKFGWIQDKYGISWQLNIMESSQKIIPYLAFVGKNFGKAEEAMKLYCSLFKDSKILDVHRAGAGEPEPEGTISHASFQLFGQQFMALESSLQHQFTFNEAISFVVNCENQEEVDNYWNKLSEGGDEKAQQCGWLKDKYGLSWQIVPTILFKLIADPDRQKAERVTNAMLQMKKLDIKTLQAAADQK